LISRLEPLYLTSASMLVSYPLAYQQSGAQSSPSSYHCTLSHILEKSLTTFSYRNYKWYELWHGPYPYNTSGFSFVSQHQQFSPEILIAAYVLKLTTWSKVWLHTMQGFTVSALLTKSNCITQSKLLLPPGSWSGCRFTIHNW